MSDLLLLVFYTTVLVNLTSCSIYLFILHPALLPQLYIGLL